MKGAHVKFKIKTENWNSDDILALQCVSNYLNILLYIMSREITDSRFLVFFSDNCKLVIFFDCFSELDMEATKLIILLLSLDFCKQLSGKW